MYIRRQLEPILVALAGTPLGRCLIVTGARQTGKTTLIRHLFGQGATYVSFDEALTRTDLASRSAAEWLNRGSSFLFDEVQKVPDFLGTIKTMLDQGPPNLRVVLTGSAQIQLLGRVRESLAGRSVTRELFPLSVAELAGCARPMLMRLLASTTAEEVRQVLAGLAFAALRPERLAAAREQLGHLLSWGGMPALAQLDDPGHRWIWLEEYCSTYLQRDVADLGRVADLDLFLRFEKLAAMRTAGLLNYADLARDADVSSITGKKYVQYLTLSYQAFLLPPFRSRMKERLIKAPRLHWLDPGVQRVLSGLRQGLTGPQLESAVVGEVYKTCRTSAREVGLFYLRTKDGREVDLLLRLPGGGYLAWEIKAGERATPVDARHLRDLDTLLDGPILGRFVIYLGKEYQAWDNDTHAVPAHFLFLEDSDKEDDNDGATIPGGPGADLDDPGGMGGGHCPG
ncbi:MAG: ATP-binding protein [Thermodesulfobacteriota bacterium]